LIHKIADYIRLDSLII